MSFGLPPQRRPPSLPYRKPQEGRDYWIQDGFLPNALEVSERCFAREDWTYGFPHRPEFWPGMRAPIPPHLIAASSTATSA